MKVVNIDPEIMSGEPVFMGTRVPVRILLDYLRHNRTVDDFLCQYPTVSAELVHEFLHQAGDSLVESAKKSA